MTLSWQIGVQVCSSLTGHCSVVLHNPSPLRIRASSHTEIRHNTGRIGLKRHSSWCSLTCCSTCSTFVRVSVNSPVMSITPVQPPFCIAQEFSPSGSGDFLSVVSTCFSTQQGDDVVCAIFVRRVCAFARRVCLLRLTRVPSAPDASEPSSSDTSVRTSFDAAMPSSSPRLISYPTLLFLASLSLGLTLTPIPRCCQTILRQPRAQSWKSRTFRRNYRTTTYRPFCFLL